MKKLFLLTALFVAATFSSCKYDDDDIWNSVHGLEDRIAKLEELCKQMNTNISSLQTLVKALQNNDYVTGVTPVTKNGETVGYTITFTKSSPITIYHGKDGADGSDGNDGHTPVIGIRQDTDGIYYWTLDGDWMLDNSGNKIKAEGRDGQNGADGKDGQDGTNGSDGKDGENGADGKDGENGKDGANGKDGIAPQLKIEDGYWFVSTDNGATWTNLGKATGENGTDGTDGKDGVNGDSFFRNVDTSDSDYVIFTLADGTSLKLPTWYAFEQLKTLCNRMNTNISSLQSIVEALQNNDYITSCTPLMENGTQIGYTITFAKSGSIIIYHGKDGADGTDGKDGTDAHSPALGAKKDTDDILYWTLDEEWLTDENGSKIAVHGRDGVNGSDGQDGTNGTDGKDGVDGITPQLKIEEGYWYVSTDNGATWTNLGKAAGENGKDGQDGANGKDGDSFFQSVTQDGDYVYLTLTSGEKISVPKHHPLSIVFAETEDIRVLASQTYSIGYTITGADDNTVIKALAQDGFRAVVKKTDNATGTIEITTPATILPSEILVFVTDGRERTIMRSINFVEGVILISTKSYTVGYGGGTVAIDLSTNIDYTVEIPEADKEWISVASIGTRAVMRDETITLTVAPNTALTARYSTVRLVDALGVTGETVLITQKSGTSQVQDITTAGTLDQRIGTDEKDVIEELTLTGTLNTFDFDFIRTMKNLKLLDLSGLDNTTLPASCLTGSTIPTVLLPLKLTAIPDRAFYQAAIMSIYIPETVETIGNYAFYQCKSIAGNLVIPDATVSIGEYCFAETTFDGTLSLGKGLETIGMYAFELCDHFTGDLVIPDNVTFLGDYTFYKSKGFTGNLVIGNGIAAIPKYAFFDCAGFGGTITLGESIVSIGDCAFAGCEKLTGNLIIPDKVETIGYNAFYNCTGFKGYLSIGSGIKTIWYGAFARYYSYSDYYPLYFSKIYCKAVDVPVLKYNSRNDTSDKASDAIKQGTAFGYNYYSAEYPAYLGVPVGCKEAYAADKYWENFDLIEEIEF